MKKMMTSEEKQILLKDLCARLPYGVKCQFKDNIIHLTGVQDLGKYGWGVNGFDIDNCKPYLRPMSSMTEEEKDELYSNIEWCADIDENGNLIIDKHTGDKVYCSTITGYVAWLLVNHFDFNKLIEKGLALEAPEDMYKTE